VGSERVRGGWGGWAGEMPKNGGWAGGVMGIGDANCPTRAKKLSDEKGANCL